MMDILFLIMVYQKTFLTLSIIIFTFFLSYNIFFRLKFNIKNILIALGILNVLLSIVPRTFFMLGLINFGHRISISNEIINVIIEIVVIFILTFINISLINKSKDDKI